MHMEVSQLIDEKDLAKALKISQNTLYKFRCEGCPWISIGGHVFYHEPTFMEWLLKHRTRKSQP